MSNAGVRVQLLDAGKLVEVAREGPRIQICSYPDDIQTRGAMLLDLLGCWHIIGRAGMYNKLVLESLEPTGNGTFSEAFKSV